MSREGIKENWGNEAPGGPGKRVSRGDSEEEGISRCPRAIAWRKVRHGIWGNSGNERWASHSKGDKASLPV
jgi:hypothetical protein